MGWVPFTLSFASLVGPFYVSEIISYRNEGKSIWKLPLLMIMWVNLHGAFVLGVGLIGIVLASETVRTFSSAAEDRYSIRQLYTLVVVLILCAFVTLANPEGYKVYEYAWTVFSDPSSRQFVTEWQAPAIDQISGVVLFYAPFFLLTSCLIWAKRRPSLTEFALYVAFSVFAMMAIRNAPWFLIIAAPMISRHLPRLHCWQKALKLSKNFDSGKGLMNRKEIPLLNAAILTGAAVFLFMRSPWLNESKLIDPKTPVGAADFIDRYPVKGKIYHPQIFGDYLIWRLWPNQKSFLDGRVHLFDTLLIKDYFKVMNDSQWEQMLEKWQIKYLLLSKNSKGFQQGDILLKARKSRGWKSVYEDSVAVLFEKLP